MKIQCLLMKTNSTPRLGMLMEDLFFRGVNLNFLQHLLLLNGSWSRQTIVVCLEEDWGISFNMTPRLMFFDFMTEKYNSSWIIFWCCYFFLITVSIFMYLSIMDIIIKLSNCVVQESDTNSTTEPQFKLPRGCVLYSQEFH